MSPLRIGEIAEESNVPEGSTLGFIGCGDMGSAILNSLLCGRGSRSKELGKYMPHNFVVSVRTEESMNRLKSFWVCFEDNVTILQQQNLEVIRRSDIIILACRPDAVQQVLKEAGVREGLSGKLLISIVAGWSSCEIEKVLQHSQTEPGSSEKRWVVRVMPNSAASVSHSMTAIEMRDPCLSVSHRRCVDTIFSSIGEIIHLPANMLDAATALCGSTPAFLSMICEGLTDGAVAMGIPREQAKIMIYQALLGTAMVLKGGEHPAILKEKSTSPGGCTIGAIMGLEEVGIRGIMAKAVRDSASIAALLGQGRLNVNRTR